MGRKGLTWNGLANKISQMPPSGRSETKRQFYYLLFNVFNNDEIADDVIILSKDGKKISRKNIQLSTNKQIRFGHNIEKLLLGGTLKFT